MLHRRVCVLVLLAVLGQGCGPRRLTDRIEGWRWIPLGQIAARVDKARGMGLPGAKVTFLKAGAERRFLALETIPWGDLSTAKALLVQYRLSLRAGTRPRLGLMVFEQDGGAWFKVGGVPLMLDGLAEARLLLRGFRPSELGEDKDGQLQWSKVARFWIGLVLDSPTEGVLTLTRVELTGEAGRPTGPQPTPFDDASLWTVGKDPAAEGKLAIRNEGPAGRPCMRFEFALPGDKHMFALPALALPDTELVGYRALRFAYKAKLPAGINGLLVSLQERNHAQYYAEPAPAPSDDWKTVTIPFDTLKLAAWTKDENGQLDLGEVESLIIGVHGTATDRSGTGLIWVTDVEFVP